MLADFILAVALICPDANTATVQEVLTTKPVTFARCEKMINDNRDKYRKKQGDCEIDLMCVRVHWEGPKD